MFDVAVEAETKKILIFLSGQFKQQMAQTPKITTYNQTSTPLVLNHFENNYKINN